MRKKRTRKQGWWLVIGCVVFLLVQVNVWRVNEWPFLLSQIKGAYSTGKEGLEGMTAKQVLLAERGGAIRYEQNSHRQTSIASLTKIMTVVCLIEASPDTQQPVRIPADIFPYIWQENLAMAGFLQDELVSLEDLLYGIMLPSGAEAALAAAVFAAGTEEAFVKQMNRKAQELEMTQTSFSNVTGADHVNHYSTASDLLKLLDYALENPTFYQLFTSFSHVTQPTAVHPDGLQLSSTLLTTGESLSWNSGAIVGGKTGYTMQAGQCLASLARVNGKEYLMILLGAEGSPGGEQLNIRESRSIYKKYLEGEASREA